MDRMGFEMGSHTHTHADLGAVPLNTVRQELSESKRVLEDRLGHQVRWFAYPFGRRECFPLERLPLVAQAGYEGCVSAHGGFVYRYADSRMLPRECVPAYGPLVLELRLSGCLNWLYRSQNWIKSGPRALPIYTATVSEQGVKHEQQPASQAVP